MDVFAAALATVARQIDPSTWTRNGRLRVPATPIPIRHSGDFEFEDDVDLAEVDLNDPELALEVVFSLAIEHDRHPPAYELVMFLQWAWGFLESASFIRVRLSDRWSLYRGMESSFGMNEVLAATSEPGIEADKEFLGFVFGEGGAAAGFEFIVSPPTHIVYPPDYTLDELTQWISDGIAPHPDAIEMIAADLKLSESIEMDSEDSDLDLRQLVRRYLDESADLTRSATAP